MSSLAKRLRRMNRDKPERPRAPLPLGDDHALLVLTCVDCPKQVAVPMARFQGRGLTKWLYDHGGWMLSAGGADRGAPPGHVLLGPLCRACGEKGMDPALLKAVDENIGNPKEPT